MNQKVFKTLSVCKLLFSECKPSINQVKTTPELTEK